MKSVGQQKGPMLERKGIKIKGEVKGVGREGQRSFAWSEVRSVMESKIDPDLPLLALLNRRCLRYIRGGSNSLFDNFDATEK